MGEDVIPLWRDAEATEPNITAGVLEALAQAYDQPVTAADLFAYCYAVMASPDYVHRFWDELTIPGPRLPITRDAALFAPCRRRWPPPPVAAYLWRPPGAAGAQARQNPPGKGEVSERHPGRP